MLLIGKKLWEDNIWEIPYDEGFEILDRKDQDEVIWQKSLTYHILDEGLLLIRDISEEIETLAFTYQLMGGYFIAKYLLDRKTEPEIIDIIGSTKFQTQLLDPDFSNRHLLSEDILKCFTLQIPKKYQKYLHDLTDNDQLFSLSVESLFDLDPKYITPDCGDLIKKLFEKEENRNPLIDWGMKTMLHPNHPLNIVYWDNIIRNLDLIERDLSWTEYIRKNVVEFNSIINTFTTEIQKNNSDEDRCKLVAILIKNTLSSTVRNIRDQATKSLHLYGLKYPDHFISLVIETIKVDDPYIVERILTASYNTIILLNKHNTNNFNQTLLKKSRHRAI